MEVIKHQVMIAVKAVIVLFVVLFMAEQIVGGKKIPIRE